MSEVGGASGDLSARAQTACKKFLLSVEAPEAIAENKANYYGLTIMLVPSSSANLEKFFMCIPKVQKELAHLRPLFRKIFRENSIHLRYQFFKHKMLRHLWARYINEEQ